MSKFLVVALFGFLTASLASAGPIGSTYDFTGYCTDCPGNASATLVLAGYTPGTALSNANFVSFSYMSPKYTYTLANLILLSGNLPSTQGPASVVIGGTTSGNIEFDLSSNADGTWNLLRFNVNGDTGNNGCWNAGAACTTSTTPEPGSVVLLGSGLVALFIAARRIRVG